MCLAVGATSRRISTHLVAIENSKRVNPVAFAPGCAKLVMNPCPTGSLTLANMMGTLFVVLSAAASAAVPSVMTTSGDVSTNSAAYLRRRVSSPSVQRYSRSIFRFTIHPSACRPDSSAWRSSRACGSLSGITIKSPIRRIRAGCCARAASDHAAGAPPSIVMNSRRLIASPEAQDKASYRLRLAHWKGSGVRSSDASDGSNPPIKNIFCGAVDPRAGRATCL